MPAFLPRHARPAAMAATVLAAATSLAGCSQDPDRFAPPCPIPSIPRDLGDLHRARGNGRDLTDSILDGRITGLQGTCSRDTPAITVASIAVGLELTRGPANPGRTADVSYFVAVSEGETILDKRIFTLHAEFPPNTERLRLEGDKIDLRLPVTPQKTAAAYRVSIGFQLTPAELEFNRTRPRR